MPLRNLSEHLHIHRGSEASVHERKDSAGVAHASTKLFRPRVRSDSLVREFGRAATMGTAIVTSPNSTDAIHSFCKENLAPLTSFSARFMTAMTTAEDFEEFINATHITIAGLEKIAAVFPFAAAAVIAFKALVGAHIRRKENNRKVLVVRAKIYDFCIALFELRHVRDPQAKDAADITLEVRMANLMQDIAQDIKWAGLVCETYEKKNALVRTLKAKIYEDRLASQINLFQRHREQFQFLLSLFINTGVQSANRKLDDASGKLQSIETKLDDIHNLFRQLDSPKEQELRGIVDRHGPATFLEDDSLLAETMQKVYEVYVNQLESDTMDTSHHYHDPNLAEFKRELLRELSEDLDATLAKNFNVFNQSKTGNA
ncbi:hypothetical protein D9757_009762 [Collybiopsis confluens]|uniref:Uncharacterized protein n=1 Tax=Collybiopsis confluens TaxID=2823264 RepID=A0A8H5LX82_9AGAR|nr:hypothetical protein D9757_009762 [Collybiopsis confluens]